MQRCRNPCNLLCIRNITKTVQNCELSAGKSLTRSTHSFERLEMQILYRGIAPSCHVEGLRWCGLTFLKIHRSSISTHNPLILSGFHYKNTLFRPNFVFPCDTISAILLCNRTKKRGCVKSQKDDKYDYL